MPESRFYVPPQEDIIDDVGLGARYSERSPIVEGNMSVGSVLASDGCDVPLQGSITEPFFQQDKHDHTVIVGPKSCKRKSPILSYCADGDGADGGGSSNQSSKVSIREGPSTHATVTPGFDRISDVLPTDASESEHLPECITAQDTTISQPDSRKAHLSALQQERGEKVTQDLEDISANIGSVEKDHIHGDLTLPSASVLLSISCNGANQGSKYETNLQPGTATEKVLFQNSDPASINKHSVLQNNNKTPVKDPEKKQQAVNEEARKEGGNDNSSHETGASSPRRCDPPLNQDVEADQDDSLTTSNQSGGSDEIEATSSNDSAKQSSPPWRDMRHSKKGLHEKELAVSSKSGKGTGKQDQHMHTSRRKKICTPAKALVSQGAVTVQLLSFNLVSIACLHSKKVNRYNFNFFSQWI
jgi:hypothetical protein